MFYKDKFKKIRKVRKITQQEMSKLIGKSLKTLQRWELGSTEPSDFFVKMLADVLNVPVNEISSLKEIESQLPLYYENLSNLDRSTYDFSTKNESEKQKVLIDLQKKVEFQDWEIQRMKQKLGEYGAIMDSLDCLIFKKDRNLRYSYVNRKFLAYFNFPDPKIVLGERNRDIWHTYNAWKELADLEQKVIEEKICIDKEVIPIPKSFGVKGVGIASIKPIFDNNNKVVEVSVSVFDVTSDSTIKEKYFYMESVLDSLDRVIMITKLKPHKHNIYVNNAVQNIYKIYKNEFYQNAERWMDFIHPDDKKNILKQISDNKKELLYRVVLEDDSIRWIKHFIHCTSIKDEAVEFCVLKDVTKDNDNQQLLEFIGTHVDIMADGLVITDVDLNKYLYLNSTITDICGYPIDFLYKKGHNFWREHIIHPDDRDEHLSVILVNNKIRDYKKRSYRYRIIRADGVLVKIEVSTKLNKFNNRFYRITTIREITDTQICVAG